MVSKIICLAAGIVGGIWYASGNPERKPIIEANSTGVSVAGTPLLMVNDQEIWITKYCVFRRNNE